MNEKAERLLARQAEALETGAAAMWRTAIADTVLVLLETDGEVTRDTLRRAIEAQADSETASRIQRATCRGALNALDGRPPRGS